MTPVAPDPAAVVPFEVARAELVEALARMVNRVIDHSKAEAQSALGSIKEIRTTLAGVAKLDDYLEDLEAAERMLRLYLLRLLLGSGVMGKGLGSVPAGAL